MHDGALVKSDKIIDWYPLFGVGTPAVWEIPDSSLTMHGYEGRIDLSRKEWHVINTCRKNKIFLKILVGTLGSARNVLSIQSQMDGLIAT